MGITKEVFYKKAPRRVTLETSQMILLPMPFSSLYEGTNLEIIIDAVATTAASAPEKEFQFHQPT